MKNLTIELVIGIRLFIVYYFVEGKYYKKKK
jgi:hypothetical protein